MSTNTLRVVTSCRSRFFVFEQARELAKHMALHQLITDYPKAWPMRFGVPKDKIRPLLVTGVINHGLGRYRHHIPRFLHRSIDQWVHNRFSRLIARLIPRDTQYFIGLSSFCLEALESCRKKGIVCHVDHASLHQKDEKKFALAEAERWGVPLYADSAAQWVIDKEDKEFQVANFIFVPSTTVRDSLVRNGVDIEKIKINPYGVELSQFTPGKKNDDTFRVIQVGKISIGKGILTLLSAFSQLDRPGSELWLAGAGLEGSGLKPTIDRMMSPGVRFLPRVEFQEGLRDYYIQCSVFVLASVADGFALVVAQAMACGLPVIVTENVGAKDLVVEGVNGFVVPTGKPEAIAEKLQFLHDNPERCREMGIAARKSVASGYSWEDYGNRLVKFVSEKSNQSMGGE